MERRAIWIRGTVQGVGFRPFVYALAQRHALAGFVRNQAGSVEIEVEGEIDRLERFLADISEEAPPLARIGDVRWERRPIRGERGFRIETSDAVGEGPIVVSADVATCPQCLAEMFDPADRRYRYPFLNCTNCGPRLTIVTGAPYDRQRTTMAGFAMCPACQAEYEDPANRRFHAQPTACPACGPRLRAMERMVQGSGFRVQAVDDPVQWFAEAMAAGKIGALKGLGGYHLACDACNAEAVRELRRRKRRDERPFAIMVRDIQAAKQLCEVTPAEQELLEGSSRPIVLLRKRVQTAECRVQSGGGAIVGEVAPGNPFLGVMLPYTPLHHLLLSSFCTLHSALCTSPALVMTSGNRSDEPIAYEDDEALARLGGIADVLLVHDRPIHVRCDDSVTRVIGGAESPVRRSRGYAPQPIRLPMNCPRPILAVGGQLKGTFALGQDRQAVVSHHMGDLDHFEAYQAFERDIALYEELFAIRPKAIAHDPHPDYASTRYAMRRAAAEGIPLIAIQHHHAHMASCMAEHGLNERVIGVSLDGTGYGTDGAIWGGEFLVGDYSGFERRAHLRYVPLPGGDAAIREPWRIALSHLVDADLPLSALTERIDPESVAVVRRMIERRINCPLTSSAGRLFDAVACLAGVRDRVSYEGQAAMELEWMATGQPPAGSYPFDLAPSPPLPLSPSPPLLLDTRPIIRSVVDDVGKGIPAATIARRFHTTMADLIVAVCGRLRDSTGLSVVTLSGGVFMNSLLTLETESRLNEQGFPVYRHRLVPPNDGGLCLGQLAIAARH